MAWSNATLLVSGILLMTSLGAFSNNRPLLAFTLIFFGFAVFIVTWQVKCPRCRLQVYSKDGVRHMGELPSKSCERCGRPRYGVWPFQYIFRSEPWDGIRRRES